MKYKKGNAFNVIFFTLILIIIVAVGLAMALGSSILSWFSDQVTPVMTNLGMAGETNLSDIGRIAFTPIDQVIQSTSWMVGVLYFVLIIGSLLLAYGFRSSQNKLYAFFFFVLLIVVIIVSIFASNTYENFYNQDDEIGLRLQEMTLASFFIINSPVIMAIIGFIGAIIMFIPSEEQEVYY